MSASFTLTLTGGEAVPENFDTVSAIVGYVARKRAGRGA